MKMIFTGLNGTVAPVVANHFKKQGHEIVQFDRNVVSIDDPEAIETFIRTEEPDMVMHFATGPETWSEYLSEITHRLNVKFVYISTVSVYGDHQEGPFDVDVTPQPTDDYGRYKYNSERIVTSANKHAWIIRIGWQIGHYPGSNNMIDFLDKTMKEDGQITASEKFYPATSFIEHTAEGIEQAIAMAPSLYQVDSNDGLSFYEIVNKLKSRHPFLKVKKSESPAKDIRMRDSRITIPALSDAI